LRFPARPGPAWRAAIGAELGSRTALKFLTAGYADPRLWFNCLAGERVLLGMVQGLACE
jgi:hypothetical protein